MGKGCKTFKKEARKTTAPANRPFKILSHGRRWAQALHVQLDIPLAEGGTDGTLLRPNKRPNQAQEPGARHHNQHMDGTPSPAKSQDTAR